MHNKGLIDRLTYPTPEKRFLFFFFSDILIIIASLFFSFLLRLDFSAAIDNYLWMIVAALPLFLVVKLSCLGLFKLYRITWRYVGLRELHRVGNAVILSEALLFLMIAFPVFSRIPGMSFYESSLQGFPRSIFFIDGVLSILLFPLLRISKRLYLEILMKTKNGAPGLRTCVIGAGNTGDMVVRDVMKQEEPMFHPVVFLDDDRRKHGSYMHNLKVEGGIDLLAEILKEYGIQAIIIAIPELNYKTLRAIYDSAKAAGVEKVKIVPRIYDNSKPGIQLKQLEDIKIEDLMGRQAVQVEFDLIDQFIRDKVVLITGAGGSIGSEIVTQVCSHRPRNLILFEIDETELHNLSIRLKNSFPLLEEISYVVGDVRDEERVSSVFDRFSPEIVFHAAAYKHVPMMEYNPGEAVKVNVFGTYNLSSAAVRSGVKRFIMISTDKAVRPTSIMGATKRIAEYICTAFNEDRGQRTEDRGQTGKDGRGTEFVSVRFGNVLGSRGSVLPLFMDQLKNGGPLTVTHEEMKRYFMTIPEAVSLVLQASVIGRGGEVMVLDMGAPVKIVTLAEELIRIHGLQPHEDITINFVGLRPGEKLFEEILTAEEGTIASRHEKVFVARNSSHCSLDGVQDILQEFRQGMESDEDWKGIKDILKRHVKHFEEDLTADTGVAKE
ncbi:MAG: polysaccharide biosynthesis protein [Nitrospirales bacterium]|nr:polysaccharide biosynthesis protein [Nitrospirales bacterium]